MHFNVANLSVVFVHLLESRVFFIIIVVVVFVFVE